MRYTLRMALGWNLPSIPDMSGFGGGYSGVIPPSHKAGGHYGPPGNAGNTAYGGGNWQSGIGIPVGGPAGGGQDPLEAWRWAFGMSQDAAKAGLDRLAPGQFLGGTLGQGAQSSYLNPQGFDPAAVEAMKAELAQMWAGHKANSLGRFGEQAAASGFGDSMGRLRGESDIRNRSTQGLTTDIRNLMMERERSKLQEKAISAGLAGDLARLEAMMNTAYAQGQLGREFPVIPGLGEEGGASGGYQWIDPATGGVIPKGNWTPEEFRQMQEERVRWLQEHGQ